MTRKAPKSLRMAQRGLNTSHDLADFLSALMSDLIEGNVTPKAGNAASNAVGKLLPKTVLKQSPAERDRKMACIEAGVRAIPYPPFSPETERFTSQLIDFHASNLLLAGQRSG